MLVGNELCIRNQDVYEGQVTVAGRLEADCVSEFRLLNVGLILNLWAGRLKEICVAEVMSLIQALGN